MIKTRRRIRRYITLPIVVACSVLLLSVSVVFRLQAQTDVRYFPETGHTLQGTFRLFWEQNGGVAVFGYPVTEEYQSPDTGRQTQYFERARFELATVNATPTVVLGMVGSEVSAGRAFPRVEPVPDTADWRYFPETGHIIQQGFKDIWEQWGGVPIFGYPISEEILEPFPGGDVRTVQYFERARFEYWPEMPPGQRVRISNLGTILAPLDKRQSVASPDGKPAPVIMPDVSVLPAQATPTPVVSTPTPIAPVPPVIYTSPVTVPVALNASVAPLTGVPGDTFHFDATGFVSNEPVGIWLTAPDHAIIAIDQHVRAGNDGALTHAAIEVLTKRNYLDGLWSINAQGIESGATAIGYFHLSRASIGASNPAHLGVMLHDKLPATVNTFIVPIAAPAGETFTMVANGFQPGEMVSGWINNPAGESNAVEKAMMQVDANGMVQFNLQSEYFINGVYMVVVKGHSSGTVRTATIMVTSDYIAGTGTIQPSSVNGSAVPGRGRAGTPFAIRATSMQPNEPVDFWITSPIGHYTLMPQTLVADARGYVGDTPPLDITIQPDMAPGVYGFHFRGRTSGIRADVYVTVDE